MRGWDPWCLGVDDVDDVDVDAETGRAGVSLATRTTNAGLHSD